jgi:hypothetical protein
LDKPLHVIYKFNKLAYKIEVILIANKRVKIKRKICSTRVFENKVLWRIFGPKRDEVTGGSRKLHNEELRDCTLHEV